MYILKVLDSTVLQDCHVFSFLGSFQRKPINSNFTTYLLKRIRSKAVMQRSIQHNAIGALIKTKQT